MIACQTCNFQYTLVPFRSIFHHEKTRRRPSIVDYDCNIQTMISCLYMGCGPRECSFLLGSLELPNVDRFPDQYYVSIDTLMKPIRDVVKAMIDDSLVSEVESAFRRKLKEENENITDRQLEVAFEEWMDGVRNDQIGIRVAYDMGWQKKSSGNRYDSLSGHCFLFGLDNKKIIGMKVYSKVCSVCDSKKNRRKSRALLSQQF